MSWQTLRTRQIGKLLMVTLCRPEQHNAISRRMLEEIQAVLDLAEADPNVRIVGLEGQPGTFCTGLDFEDIATQNATPEIIAGTARLYFQTLLRFRRLSKLVACRVDGRVQAGGVGFVAACDYAMSSSTATFQLSEILLGLLPATVMPFLIRRVGQHAAFRLSLTAQVLTADQAATLGLVDEMVPSLEDGWRRFLISSERLTLPAVAALKNYSQELEDNLAALEPLAVSRITDLLCLPATQERIRELQQHGLWQTGRPGGTGGAAMSDVVNLTYAEPGIALVELADRANSNLFSRELVIGLFAAFERIRQDAVARTVVVHGYDSLFCTGGTKDELLGIFEGRIQFTDVPLYRLCLDCEVPVIAAMQGHALGGGFIFGLFADLVVLAEESLYGANFMKYGFTPGMGATLILPYKLGPALAAELLYTAENFSGRLLRDRGVPFPVVKRKEVISTAMRIAHQIVEKPVNSLKLLKQQLTRRLVAELPRTVQEECDMHRVSFAQPEVRQRIESLFGT